MRDPSPARSLALGALGLAVAALPQPASARPEKPRFEVPRAASPIQVDGVLDEAAWAEALRLSLDYEIEPRENLPAPVATECLLTYDESGVYVAFRAEDPEPSAIRARFSDRDRAFDDDFVGIIVDTFNDERRGFEFFVNPLGVQMDLVRNDVGGGPREDSSWDAIWHSAGRVTNGGYVVEMAIPFTSLRFQDRREAQTWGVLPFRVYPRSLRHQITTVPFDRDVDCFFCQIPKVTGFAGAEPGKNLEINPTVTGRFTQERPEDHPTGDFTDQGPDGDPGITVHWGVTPSLALDATVNPDFSQVEADVAQLDVNTQFALFFPEKRPFFLEGADFFATPVNTVFTRNVADPRWGGKLSGKQGKSAFGLFVAEDEITNLLIPGSQGSEALSLDQPSTDVALRYRRDVGGSSAVGLLYTGRDGEGYASHLFGLDGLYRFTDSDSVRFQLLGSRTEYPRQVLEETDQPGGSLSGTAVYLNYDHDARNWGWFAVYDRRGTDFRADLGFMPRTDFTLGVGGLSYTWWGEEDARWTRIEVGADWDRTEDGAGQVLEEEWEAHFEIGGPRQSFLFFGLGTRDRFFDGVSFEGEVFQDLYLEIQPTADVALSLFANRGDTIDFANTRPADRLRLEPALTYRFGKHLRATLLHTHERLDRRQGRLLTADLSQLTLVYQLNLRTFVRLISQLTDIEREPELFTDEVEPRTRRLFNQLLFSYKVNPRTVLFLGYSDTHLGEQDLALTQQDRTLFMKIGYAWVL